MQTIEQNASAVGSSVYWGNCGDWLIVLAVHRDSGALDRSNFEVARGRLLSSAACREWAGEAEPVQVVRFSHWAVGWVDYLVINPACGDAVAIGEEIQAAIADYPVLDENHFSGVERREADEVWRECYRPAERVEYISKHRGQFEFRDFADLLGCVRGNHFAGYVGIDQLKWVSSL